MGTYQALVRRQEDGDTGVDLADGERDEHAGTRNEKVVCWGLQLGGWREIRRVSVWRVAWQLVRLPIVTGVRCRCAGREIVLASLGA
jgi:hypothetical protein